MKALYESKADYDAEQAREMEDLFVIADADLNSDFRVHDDFARAKGEKSFARYALLPRVQAMVARDGFSRCHKHQCLIIARRLAAIWYAQKEEA